MHQMKFAVVIPMYNEERGAEACVKAVCHQLGQYPESSTLITVNDGSADGTGELLNQLAPQYKALRVVTHPKNKGYGAALQSGVEEAARSGCDYVLFMDSDLTNSPIDIPKFVALMEQGIDVIKATRYSSGGSVSGVPFYRVAISVVGNQIAHLLYGVPVHDCTNGFRSCKVSLLTKMRLTENRFPIIMEELYWSKFLAKSYAEVPVVLTNRPGELRETSFVYSPKVFYNYLKYPVRAALRIRPAGMLV